MLPYTNIRILGIDMTLQQKVKLCVKWMIAYLCIGLFTGIVTGYLGFFLFGSW